MSSRTAESNKAILVAWDKEQELVQEGRGTREWTPQQQQDILDKGKAYDENGIAFQGQHMKSVEEFPDYQGDSGNIQFLTRAEHLEAHDGNWRNPTNWYFDPVTKEKSDFGAGGYIKCEIIQLAKPVNITNIKQETEKEINQESLSEVDKKAESNKKYTSLHESVPPNNIKDITMQEFIPKLKSSLKTISKTIIEFSDKHPNAMKAIKDIVVFVGTMAVVKESSRSGSSNSEYRWSDDDRAEYEDSYDDYSAKQDTSESSERTSPDEHIVRGHEQRYHYKDGSVKWKDKNPYPRGGNIEE